MRVIGIPYGTFSKEMESGEIHENPCFGDQYSFGRKKRC